MSQHIELRRRRWYAVLDVPIDLRGFFGKGRLVKSLETDSRATALRRAAPLIASWKAEFQAGRSGSSDPVDQDIKYLRNALSLADPSSEVGEFSERGLLDDSIRNQAMKMKDGGSEFYRRAIGELVGTLEHVEEWFENLDVTDKTKDMSRSDIERLSRVFPNTNDITREAVHRWTLKLVKEENLKPKTVARIVSACRGYWRHLQAINVASKDAEPFHNLEVSTRAKKKASPKDQRREFKPSDIVALREVAANKGDNDLADLINLGMWTGCRIEEFCSLKIENVKGDYIEIEDAKTPAGWRQVPIHTKLKGAIMILISEGADGYIISGLSPNKYGDKSNAIGKRFGRLKTAMGYDRRHVFHSIRKTVATLLENAGVPENVAAEIIGHDKPTMTYGTYSGGLSLEVKREALEKIDYPILDVIPNI